MRTSGIFLHPTSLPSSYGIGDLGDSARWWVDLLAANLQSYWQICPLGPTGYGDSPYQSFCSFAGNTLLISPAKLIDDGLLSFDDVKKYPVLSQTHVEFGPVIQEKEKLYKIAFSKFVDTDDYLEFCKAQAWWLDDYALFRVIKEIHEGKPWWEWEQHYRLRSEKTLADVSEKYSEPVRYHKFLQFLFQKQWLEIRRYANEKDVRIIGDVPYYTAYDSSDTWAEPHLFEFDKNCAPERVAGVPPDYFSETGQLWGNPLYRWDVMKKDGYSWWGRRFRKILEWADIIRIDHFRAFDSYWAIPAKSETAINGVWEQGPGIDFFLAIKNQFGELPLIAEDLGDITPDVLALRERIGAPGMKILQFAFDGNPTNPYLPYNIGNDSVTYTGTHDNDTSVGWFRQLSETDKHRVCEFLGCTEDAFLGSFLRCAYSSPSQYCIIPLQDVLGLDSAHRMNTPGTQWGNWSWRFTEEMISESALSLIRKYTMVYGRAPGSGFCL